MWAWVTVVGLRCKRRLGQGWDWDLAQARAQAQGKGRVRWQATTVEAHTTCRALTVCAIAACGGRIDAHRVRHGRERDECDRAKLRDHSRERSAAQCVANAAHSMQRSVIPCRTGRETDGVDHATRRRR